MPFVKQTPKEAGWYVADDAGKIVSVDPLLADDKRADGWVSALEEFQEAIAKFLESN